MENAEHLYDASLLGQSLVLEGEERRQTAERIWKQKVIPKIWNYYLLKAQHSGLLSWCAVPEIK